MVIIKKEEDTLQIPTDDECSTGDTAPPPATTANEINEANLVELSGIQAAEEPYPPGCPIWYNLQRSTNVRMCAKQGVVDGIFIDLISRNFVCKVVCTSSQEGDESSSTSTLFLMQDQLVFAINCPVKVKGMVENEPDKELDGVIVCPKPGAKSYSVQFLSENNDVRVEIGVCSDRIRFRYAADNNDMKYKQRELSKTKPSDNRGISLEDVTIMQSGGEAEESQLSPLDMNIALDNEAQHEESSKPSSQNATDDVSQNSSGQKREMPMHQHEDVASKTVSQPNASLDQSGNDPSKQFLSISADEQCQEVNKNVQISHENSAFSKPPSKAGGEQDSGINEIEHLSAKRWQPPSPEKVQPSQYRMIVPLWVTSHTKRSLFVQIVGQYGKELGWKTNQVEAKTSCTVDISRTDRINNVPMYVTVRPKTSRNDMLMAKEMVEDSMLEFLECEGAKARFNYELAISYQDSASSGAIQQRKVGTSKNIWMKLLDLPIWGENAHRSLNVLKHKVERETQCSVEIYGQQLGNLRMPVELCKPFALITGQDRDQVDYSSRKLEDFINREDINGAGGEHQNEASGQRSSLLNKSSDSMSSMHNIETTKTDIQSGVSVATPKSYQSNADEYCKLTVPLWVTESTSKNLFFHIVGQRDGKMGYQLIESETGCTVDIAQTDKAKKTPMYITLRPRIHGNNCDIAAAIEMIEDCLLDFLDTQSAQVRLLYELVASMEGLSQLKHIEDGLIYQRFIGKSKEKFWMKLFDLSMCKRGDIDSLKEAVRVLENSECWVKVYRSSGQSKHVECYNPFVLVSGRCKKRVAEFSKMVSSMMTSHCSQRYANDRNVSSDTLVEQFMPPIVGAQKRKSAVDSIASGTSDERSSKMRKIDAEQQSTKTCELTVPLWVMEKCTHTKELFVHILGSSGDGLGHKTREISSATQCKINVSPYTILPMTITIKSDNTHNMKMAIKMIEESLIRYLDDDSSEGRLVYDLAVTAEGNYFINKTSEGLVRQESHTESGVVWMQVIELPFVNNRGKAGGASPHGGFLLFDDMQSEVLGDSNCSIEVCGFGDNVPMWCNPYVLITGNKKDDVSQVAGNVTDKLLKHQARCRCQFPNYK